MVDHGWGFIIFLYMYRTISLSREIDKDVQRGLDPKEEFRSKHVSKSVIYVSPP